MKKFKVVAIIEALGFIVCTSFCFSQGGWVTQTSGTSNILLDVCFVDSLTGWAVGDGGTILSTTDGGNLWTPESSGTTRRLNAVDFVSSTDGWCVGYSIDVFPPDSGIILRTTDGGKHWNSQDAIVALYGVDFITSSTGWVAGMGGTMLRSTDGGTTWQNQSTSTLLPFLDISFLNNQTGWAVGGYEYENLIRKTTDGGTTWLPETSSAYSSFIDLSVVDSMHAWATGNPGAFRTTDGGANWYHLTLPSSDVDPVATVFFADNTTGWAAGGYGPYDARIYKTTDGGTNWDSQYVASTDEIFRIFFTDKTHGWGVGFQGSIVHTTNGGVTAIGLRSNEDLPGSFALRQNYPNPFNPTTQISYEIRHAGYVTLRVFNLLGEKIATLVSETKAPGIYSLSWDALKQPAGIYILRLDEGGAMDVKEMVLVK